MRKLFILLQMVGLGSVAQTTDPSPYCISSFTSTSMYPEISKVEVVNTFTNISAKTPAPGYMYYDNLNPIGFIYSSPAVIKVTLKNVDMETMLKVWIDYNQNNVFNNSELVMSVVQGSVGTGTSVVKQATVNVPITMIAGLSRMRVSLGWHYANWGSSTFRLDSCHIAATGDGSAGETEDYKVLLSFPLGAALGEIKAEREGSAFPVPAHEHLFIDEMTKEPSILDMTGRAISVILELNEGVTRINVSDLSPGTYYLKYENADGKRRYRKFIKD